MVKKAPKKKAEFFRLPPDGPKSDEDQSQEVFLWWDYGMFLFIAFVVLWCLLWCVRPRPACKRPDALARTTSRATLPAGA